jgi:hypothetical protein
VEWIESTQNTSPARRRDPRVASVTANAAVQMMSTTYVPGQDVNSLYSLGNMVGTRGWWNKYTGAGVDVALVDTGVSPVVGLADPGKIVNGPDLTPESQNPDTAYLDSYGHGTFMAGIIAGHDPGVDPATNQGNSKVFLGVAPDTRIVSVKAADAHRPPGWRSRGWPPRPRRSCPQQQGSTKKPPAWRRPSTVRSSRAGSTPRWSTTNCTLKGSGPPRQQRQQRLRRRFGGGA